MASVIEFTDLTKKYGSFTAVDSLNLSISEGEIFGLLGPNGAGKSTTILMMLGLTNQIQICEGLCIDSTTINPVDVKKKQAICRKMLVSMMIIPDLKTLCTLPDSMESGTEAREKVNYIL